MKASHHSTQARSSVGVAAAFLDTICPFTACLAQCLAFPFPPLSPSTSSVRLRVGKNETARFHRIRLIHSHDMWMSVGHIQNIGSGAPRGTGSCCHQPALLTWASNTRLFSRSAPVAGGLLDPPALPLPYPPSKHFSAVPREVGPRANKFQNFQSPPGSQQ